MTRFRQLIDNISPAYLNMEKLGDHIELYTGVQFNKSDMAEEGTYPVINGGILPSGYTEKYNEPGNTITVSQGGASAGYVNYLTMPFWAGAHCFVLRPKSEDVLLNRYLYHFIKQSEMYLQQSQQGAGIPSVNRDKINGLTIPLPPLSIQQEIVSVLDSFTALIDKMKQEVEKRKKQMEYYREKLLTFENGECEWKMLEDILVIKAGGDVPEGTIKGQTFPTESCPYPVYSNGTEEQALYGYCPNYRNSNDAITVSARGSIGYHTVRKGGFSPIIRLITMEPKTNDNIFYINYALYLTEILGSQGGIPQLTVPMIKRIAIPIPSLDKQARIVSTLDKFESYILKLEKMIELRQKQYEYYREQLLTFE